MSFGKAVHDHLKPDHANLRRLVSEGTKLPWYPQGARKNGKAVYRVKPADEALICAAVNSLPALLAEIETLKAQQGNHAHG